MATDEKNCQNDVIEVFIPRTTHTELEFYR